MNGMEQYGKIGRGTGHLWGFGTGGPFLSMLASERVPDLVFGLLDFFFEDINGQWMCTI